MSEWPRPIAMRFGTVLAAEPDLILWVLTSKDVGWASVVLSLPAKPPTGSLFKEMINRAKDSKTAILARTLLYQDPQSFISLYLKGGDSTAFLKAEPDAGWKKSFALIDGVAADIGAQSNGAHVPFAAVFLPNRAQALRTNGPPVTILIC